MNHHLNRLSGMAKKSERLILGLMSGTSADGLDMAICRVSGKGLDTKIDLTHFNSVPYSSTWRKKLLAICSRPETDALELCLVHTHLAQWQAKQILRFLKDIKMEPQEVDLIASHGHTFYHAPYSLHKIAGYGNATMQIVDGDHIAHETGIITISDFRQKHVAAGGEGAPLALYGDFLLFSHQTKNRILLNIGGISNFSHLPPGQDFASCFASDVGPGNTLMDKWIQHISGELTFDKDGEMASKGNINPSLLEILKENPFIKLPLPKSTGPETFNEKFLNEAIEKCKDKGNLTNEDVMATLNRYTAACIYEAIESLCRADETELVISGGGVFNGMLMRNLKSLFSPKVNILKSEDLGIASDAKEAVLFALLANETVCGSRVFDSESKRGLNMGKISLPD